MKRESHHVSLAEHEHQETKGITCNPALQNAGHSRVIIFTLTVHRHPAMGQ